MNKSILALAAISFSGALFAQTSGVTVYGLIDLGIAKGNGGTAPNFGANGTNKSWTMKQASSSRLGFRGTEDLGGGLSAQFLFDHRLDPTTGAAIDATRFWNGQTWIRLSSKGTGSFTLGRQIIPLYWVIARADPWDWTGVASPGNAQLAGFSTQGSGNAFRMSNAVSFRSADFGGLAFEAMVGLPEDGTLGRNHSFNFVYKNGPLYAGLGYAGINGGNPAEVDGNRLVTGTVAYKIGTVDLSGNYGEAKVGGGRLKNKTGNIAAQIELAKGIVKVAYSRTDPNGANNTQSQFGLGYEHPLSKRTNLYANYGVGTQENKTRNTAVQIGYKHLF